MSFASPDLHLRRIPAAAILLLAGCANLPAPQEASPAPPKPAASAAPPAAAGSAPSAGATPARPDPSALRPFAEVIKDAKREDGLLPVWRKDEKTWLEIPAAQIDKPILVTMNISHALGERGFYASAMGRDEIAEFRRVGNQVQLLARNLRFRATGDATMQRSLVQSFSDSLIAAAPMASQPHPERKSVLVDAAFLLADLQGYGSGLEAAYRLPYAVDRANSYFETVRGHARLTSLNAQLHYSVARLPPPPVAPPPPGTPPPPRPPGTVPDPRSLFIGVVYNFAALPDTPMAPRVADPRIGHFTDSFIDFGNEARISPRVHHVQRWRLEKKDPAAALSEPVKPITFWLDRNIPLRYRGAVEAGVLEWNKAFERIGFKNALVVRQQPDDASFDTLDTDHASIRWFASSDVTLASGPSHSDPRTGEILDADIKLGHGWARLGRRAVSEEIDVVASVQRQASADPWRLQGNSFCSFADGAAAEGAFALDLLEARGDLEPDSPEAETFVGDVLKNVITHEVGHTLGLKHNFRASTAVRQAQLRDKAFTDANGISGSVMDYTPFNLPLAGESKGSLNNGALGPYDYWAIEYAYKPIAGDREAAELARISSRGAEPELAFGDDADAGGVPGSEGVDPRDNAFDLGDDPLAFARRRMTLSRELWDRAQKRLPGPGDDPLRQRRALASGFQQISMLPGTVAKYVGGMYTERDLPGTTRRPNYRPVEPERQRDALRFLTDSLFRPDSFRFKPEFLATLPPDYNEWVRGGPVNVTAAVLALQSQALDRLLAAGTAQRLLNLPYFLPESDRRGVISLNEVYTTVQSAVWKELESGSEIDPMRRNLQREHLRRLTTLLTRGVAGLPADALSLARWQAGELQGQLKRTAGRGNLSIESRAHLQDSLGTLTEALRATMQRG